MRRFDCLQMLVEELDDQDLVVTNLGMVVAELQQLRSSLGDFYLWHALGMATSVGLGLALALPRRRVWVLEGDGALFMNLGSLATIAQMASANLRVIVFDNAAYEACGRPGDAHPTASARGADIAVLARGAGIKKVHECATPDRFAEASAWAAGEDGPLVLVVRTEPGAAPCAPVVMDAVENKYRFIRWIEQTEGVVITPRFE